MKFGMNIVELAKELSRQNSEKRDFLVDSRNMTFDVGDGGEMLSMTSPQNNSTMIIGVNEIAHNQIGQKLEIPSGYYDRMREKNPELLALNINSWFQKKPTTYMVRTMTSDSDEKQSTRFARAFLSDRYRPIDNFQVAETVLPIIANLPDARIESCNITDRKMYIKVVNPRLTANIKLNDVVQSGIIISNSEVGMGNLEIQPLVYRLVCKNGMVVNDAATKRRHVGRKNIAGEDFSLYTDETLKLDNAALMAKIRDTVRAIAEQTRFDRVVQMMRNATEAKIETPNIPVMVELTGTAFGFTKQEGTGILNHLIREGDLSLYGMSNAVTRFAQDVDSYDRSTELESIGYNILGMSPSQWKKLNTVSAIQD